MGYFANNTESGLFVEKFCRKCRHWMDGRNACPIYDAHWLFCYAAKGSTKEILDMLITGASWEEMKCAMFAPKDK